MAKASQSAEKPVLLAISHGVYSAIPDKKRAIQNMFCLILVVAIALSMNSNSWYVVSEYEERGEEERKTEEEKERRRKQVWVRQGAAPWGIDTPVVTTAGRPRTHRDRAR